MKNAIKGKYLMEALKLLGQAFLRAGGSEEDGFAAFFEKIGDGMEMMMPILPVAAKIWGKSLSTVDIRERLRLRG